MNIAGTFGRLFAAAVFLFGLHVAGSLAFGQEPAKEAAPAKEPEKKAEPPKPAAAPEKAAAKAPAEPLLGKFITVSSPVDDVVFGKVTNAALGLQSEAVKENRRGVLVLEITSGTSQFHQVDGLARFLTSAQLSKITTVAWVPKSVTGNNVILALACNEIVMHPDAELGDVGRGQAVDRDEQQRVLSLIEKRRNRKVSPALALGMMDPQRVTLRVKLQPTADAAAENRVTTPEELKLLQDAKGVILDVQTIKEAGTLGTYSGSKARALDVLVVQIAEGRDELIDLYQLTPVSRSASGVS